MSNERTLVIVLGETRAWEKTYENFNENVLRPTGADLCVCIGVKNDYNCDNPYYKNAKYRFVYDEPLNDDWSSAFNYAEFIENGKAENHEEATYDLINDRNPIFSKLSKFYNSTDNIEFLGRYPSMEKILEDPKVVSKNYDEIVYHIPQLTDPAWRYCAYGIKNAEKSNPQEYTLDFGINMYKRRTGYSRPTTESWRRFLKIKSQFLGGIKDDENQHEGSAGILIFLRWFLYKKLVEHDILGKYDRFIITRSDYIWRLEHPSLENLSPDKIWIPNCETYDGVTDRHAVIPRKYMYEYCGLLYAMIGPSADEYYEKMKEQQPFNLEKFILFHLTQCGLADTISYFPYVAFTIRPPNVHSRWGQGFIFHGGLQSFIKYVSEDRCSQEYVNEFVQWMTGSGQCSVQEFYKSGVIPAKVRHYY